MKNLLTLLALFAGTAAAADISGTWKGTAEGPQGTIERTFVLKAEGTKLTGKTTSSMLGDSVINDGKIDGDNLTFTIDVNFGGEAMKLNYRGKVTGDTIKFTVDAAGNTIEYVCKKVS